MASPQNALTNDQLERLRRLLRGSQLDLSFALHTGDSDAVAQSLGEEPAESERLTRAAIRSDPPMSCSRTTSSSSSSSSGARTAGSSRGRCAISSSTRSTATGGALATEIACLIHRLKAHAGLRPRELVAIGTSATVAAKEGGSEALARFAATLFGETVAPEDIIGGRHAEPAAEGESWTPPPPDLDEAALRDLDPGDGAAVVALAERLTGRPCPATGPVADRVAAVLRGNCVVRALEEIFAEPASLGAAAEALRGRLEERAGIPPEEIRREIEACLLVGSARPAAASTRAATS